VKLNNEKKNNIEEINFSKENFANTAFENSTENFSIKNKNFTELKIMKTINISFEKVTKIFSPAIFLNTRDIDNFFHEDEIKIFEKEIRRISELIAFSRNLYEIISSSTYKFLINFLYDNQFSIQHHFVLKKILNLVTLNDQNVEEIHKALELIQDRVSTIKVHENTH
jgi:hypothetical protein